MGGGGGGQVKTGRLTVLQNFGLKLTLYLIKWKIKNCNIRKDIWKVSFNKRKQICFSVLGLVLNGCCPKALLGGSSKDDDSNERNNLARASRFFLNFSLLSLHYYCRETAAFHVLWRTSAQDALCFSHTVPASNSTSEKSANI